MTSPSSSPATGIVSANIKLFNSKSESEPPPITKKPQLPSLPPKPANIKVLLENDISTNNNINNNQLIPPPPPPPPPPPRPSVTKLQKHQQQNTKKLSTPHFIPAQKSGSSTLKNMFGKVVESVSGKEIHYMIECMCLIES